MSDENLQFVTIDEHHMTQHNFGRGKALRIGQGAPPEYKQLWLGTGLFIFGLGAIRGANVTLGVLLLAAGAAFIGLGARSFLAARRRGA